MASVRGISITSTVGAQLTSASSAGHIAGRQSFNYFNFFTLAGSLLISGGLVALFFNIGSVTGLNATMITWPVAVLLFLMLSNDLSGALACRALAGFFVLAIAGLVVFISAASMGLEVPGGIANFTCNSTSLSGALNGSGTIEAEERNFFTGCDRGWSELLNYNGMRVGRKCCVKVDIRNLNCQGTGLRLVADATANTQVLTDTSEREAAVRCCPSVGAEVTPTGYASMITTALSATLMSILVNLLRHLGVFRALITSPLQSFLACMSGLSEGCGSCLIALFGLCINKRVLLGDRGRSVRSREKLTVSSELVNTLTSALSSTFNAPATMVPMMDKEEQPAAAYQEKEAASGVTEVTEFAVDGKHVMSFETATAVTMCGRYSLVFGHAISGAPHELLYDMKYQAGIHGPVRMKHEHNDAGAETRDAGQRLTSRIPSRGRNVWFSECSRFVVYEHDEHNTVVARRNTAMSSVNVNGDHESCPLEVPLPRFSCAEYGGVQFDEELVCTSALCARDGVNYFIAVKNNPREVVMVMMEEVFRQQQQQRRSRVKKHDNDASGSPSSDDDDDDDDEGATLVTVKPCPEVDEEYAYLSSSGFLVLAPSTGGAVQVYDLLSADCKLVASLELPENITSLDYRTVETRGDALVITTSENERHQQWVVLTIGKPATAGDAPLLPTATMRSLHTSDVYDATRFEVLNKGTGVMDVRGFSRRAVLVPSGGVAIVMNTSGDSPAMNKFVYYDVGSTSVTHTWDFPADTSIEEFLVCRNQEGSLVVAAYDGTRVYLKNAADGTDLVKPVEQTQYRCMSAAANEQLFFIHTRDAVEVYSTSLKGPTLEDHLQATVLGDFYTAIISSDGLLLACDCYNEWLLTTTTGSGLCTIASPQNDIVVTVTNSTTVTLNVATWKLGCEDCTTRGLFCQKRVTQGRYAECVGSHEVLLPGAPRALHLTEDATLLVVHSADGQILLFDTSAATSARQKQRKPSSTAAAVGDDVTELCELESELQRSLSAVRRIHTDGIGEQVRYSLVRCSTSSSGVTGVVGLVRGECVYNIEHGATLTAHIVYVHKGSVVGYETLSLLSKVPRSMLQPIPISADDSLCCSCHVCDCNSEEDDFGTSAEAREIPPMFDMELGDEEGSVVNVEDIALNCDGTILAVWLRRHSKVLVFPVSRNLAAQCSDEAVEGTKALEALILEPSPLLAEVYIDASMRSSCTGRLQFLAAEPCALVRYSRPSQHWTYHIEQWDLSPKQQQQLTMITTTSVEAPAVVSMGDNKEDEASLALEPKPRALDNQLEEENESPTDFIYTEPVRTDRVGYMSGDPALCSLVMSASGNHMTHLSTNGVSLYRRAPSGDDNDEEANRFFWWSAFVADLYAPSEYLLIPCLCLVFGCISSIVVTAMNAEGFSGFISRVVNGSTLQNWVDVVTVFVCRSVIVRSEFLPICGDAVSVIVSSNDPVVRGQERKDLSWNLLVGQAFFVVLYPVYIYMFPGLAYVMSSLNPLLFVVGFFGYLAAVFLVVRRSFDRTRKVAAIAAAPSNSTTSDKPPVELPQRTFSQRWSSWTHIISTNVHFYAVILRLFLLAFIMMISCNFTLQVATRMSTNAGLMMMGSGDYARYYDPCLQYSNTPCDTCTAHSGCSYCATSRQCVGSSRSDSPCGAIESAGTRECYAYSNATCALYDDDGPFCVGWSNCAYCSASGNCTRTFESNCSVPIVTATNHSFSPTYFTTNSTNSDKWWGNLPYLSDDTVAYAQLLFYELQISSGTCSAARVTETTWANANYITSLF